MSSPRHSMRRPHSPSIRYTPAFSSMPPPIARKLTFDHLSASRTPSTSVLLAPPFTTHLLSARSNLRRRVAQLRRRNAHARDLVLRGSSVPAFVNGVHRTLHHVRSTRMKRSRRTHTRRCGCCRMRQRMRVRHNRVFFPRISTVITASFPPTRRRHRRGLVVAVPRPETSSHPTIPFASEGTTDGLASAVCSAAISRSQGGPLPACGYSAPACPLASRRLSNSLVSQSAILLSLVLCCPAVFAAPPFLDPTVRHIRPAVNRRHRDVLAVYATVRRISRHLLQGRDTLCTWNCSFYPVFASSTPCALFNVVPFGCSVMLTCKVSIHGQERYCDMEIPPC